MWSIAIKKNSPSLGWSFFFIILILFFIGLVTISQHAAAWDGQRKRVLLISSYHPGFPTFFQQIDGIKSVFASKHIMLDVEFMDTKRLDIKDNWENFLNNLTFKIANIEPYDIIMTADDNALKFALEHQHDLFKGLPIVFFGVNNVDKAIQQNNNEMVAGIVEAVSMEDTISLMLKLHPKTKRVMALVDSTPSGQGDRSTFYSLAGRFKGVKFEEINLTDISFAQFKQSLRELDDETVVLLLSAYRDNHGKVIQFHEVMELISRNISRPLYHLWHHGMGDGVLGGKMISHFDQGRSAALIALDIMQGTPPGEILVSSKSPNKYYFDYRQLQRFRLSSAELPAGSVVLFEPDNFIKKHKILVFGLAIVFFGLVAMIMALSLNVMRRKQAEDSLRESEGRFRSTFEQAAVGIIHLSLDGEFLRVNQRYCDMLGYSRDEFMRLKLRNITYPDDVQASDLLLRKVLSGEEKKSSFEKRYKKKDGTLMWGNITVSLRLDELGHPVCFIGVLEDIDERKAAEKEKEKLEGKLRQAQKMEAIGTLAGGVAHDFNNLLAAILGYSELALDSVKAGEECIEDIEQLIKSAERGRELVKQILTFSRKVPVELRSIDLNEEVARVLAILERTLPKMIKIETHLDPELKHIEADQTQIEQVLLNLGANAADAMSDGGLLKIKTCNIFLDEDYCRHHAEVHPGQYVLMEVSDTGSGMEKHTLSQIFDPFFSTKTIGKGTGLGLSTVFGIIKEHSGNISCYSEPGQGTVFKIFLPVSEQEKREQKEDFHEMAAMETGGSTILFVDDEQALREIAAVHLVRAGYKVITVGSGELALEMYKAGDIDLVVLDLSMPGLGGLACLKALLAHDPLAKVLITSGYSEGTQVNDAVEAGAKGYLPKPTGKSQLLSAVYGALNS